MKNIFICFKVKKIYFFMVICIAMCMIVLFIKHFYIKDNIEAVNKEKYESRLIEETISNKDSVEEQNINNNINKTSKQNVINVKEEQKEYETMPQNIKGYKVIGKIQIPKINLETYILSETSNKTLNVSVAKLYGPKINKIGNFCIAGHNSNNNMFKQVDKLDIKDKIILTDTYDNSITYEVYDKFKTTPKDVSCLEQNTNGEREVTLITCTIGGLKRVIVKAVELYD